MEYLISILTFLESKPVILSLLSVFLGFFINVFYEKYKNNISIRKELKANNNLVLSGDDWIAAWQTSVDNELNINTENIIISQSGGKIFISNKEKSPENPIGGYKWEGVMDFYHGTSLLGKYKAIECENNTSIGIMYFSYNSQRKMFIGKWVGQNIDGPLVSGLVTISKDKTSSIEKLEEIHAKCKTSENGVILSNDFI